MLLTDKTLWIRIAIRIANSNYCLRMVLLLKTQCLLNHHPSLLIINKTNPNKTSNNKINLTIMVKVKDRAFPNPNLVSNQSLKYSNNKIVSLNNPNYNTQWESLMDLVTRIMRSNNSEGSLNRLILWDLLLVELVAVVELQQVLLSKDRISSCRNRCRCSSSNSSLCLRIRRNLCRFMSIMR